MKNTCKKVFTIILVIVIAVIAILAAVLTPIFSNVTERANQSAVLQEARNKYTEIYARDMSDGTLDKKDGKTDITDEGYTVTNGKATYTYTKNSYTATYDGSEWSVTKG